MTDRVSRFELAPPRRFVLPAVLLLLSEAPGHGYRLEKDLRGFGFGPIDRPTVYRALAHLQADGLVESAPDTATTRQARRVYRITPLGERVLRLWMNVIKEERDDLGRVLRRYQATGTADAMLAEVEGGWVAPLASLWSPVSSTSPTERRLTPVATEAPAGLDVTRVATATSGDTIRKRFRLVADRSVVLIEVRSTVGPISFGAVGVTGSIAAELEGDTIRPGTQPAARIEVAVDGLSSGNVLYDAELARRIDARRYPVATLDLQECVAIGSESRYRLGGQLTFHGVTRSAYGTVHVSAAGADRLVVTGEQVFDIRDFAVPSPTMLMLRIYPDVRVRLHVEADVEEA